MSAGVFSLGSKEANTHSSGKITELWLGGSDDGVENGLHCEFVCVFVL